MKTIIISALFVIGLTSCYANQGDAAKTHKFISVSGVSEIKVEPDTAEINLTIEHIEKTSEISRNAVNQTLSQLTKSLKNFDVLSVQQSQIQQGKHRVWENRKQLDKGYYSRASLTLKTESLDELIDIYDTLAAFDTASVQYTRFYRADKDKLYQDQLAQALKNAKSKANTTLKSVNESVGEVIEVIEQGAQPVFATHHQKANLAFQAEAVQDANYSVDFQEVTIRATINATFKIK